jgi:hypothetical protein
MRRLWQVVSRTLFWSYERGTWQYDILVAAIVLFVFLSPRGWFRDQPEVGPPPHSQQVQLLEGDPSGRTNTYRVDAHLFAPPARTPELERRAHDILGKNVAALKGRTFQIERIEPVLSEDGTVLYYDVFVKR